MSNNHEPNLILKAKQYLEAKELMFKLGYAKQMPRRIDVRTRATLDSDGNQENAAGYTLEFFEDTASALAQKTQSPKIKSDGVIPSDFLVIPHGLSVEFNQQTSTFTATEVNEILEKLSAHMLVIQNGTDIIYERRVGYLLTSYPGYRLGHDNAGTSLVSRSRVEKMIKGDDFEDPILLVPGSQIKATLHGATTWTTTDDVLLDINFHSWMGIKGNGAERVGTVVGMNDARRALGLRAA